MDDTTDEGAYRVVVNDEGFYSIWQLERALPAGWYDEGTTGPRADCLDHIERVWVDMRPRSVRAESAGDAGGT